MDTVIHVLPKFKSRITTALTPTALTIVLASVTNIPTVNFMAILDDSSDVAECVWVTGVNVVTKTLTVERAQRGTTAVAHAVGVLLHFSEVPLGDLGFFEVWETAGETGRPFESQLRTNVLLGGWANGIKGYVDCDSTGGSTGLLSGVNGEIKLPNAAGAGAYFALEGEVVFQTSTTINPYGSTAGFLHLGITPAGAGSADFQDYGVFMSVWGLTNEVGHVLSLDYHTLRCDFYIAGHLTKYLVLSKHENYIEHTFTALDPADRIASFRGDIAAAAFSDWQGLFEIAINISGSPTGAFNATATMVDITNGITCDSYLTVHTDSMWDNGATMTGAKVCWAKYSCNMDSDPRALNLWTLNFAGAHGTLDAIFEVNDPEKALGYIDTQAGGACGSIPFHSCGYDGIKYIMLYANNTGA